jgi:hypothetical protein
MNFQKCPSFAAAAVIIVLMPGSEWRPGLPQQAKPRFRQVLKKHRYL